MLKGQRRSKKMKDPADKADPALRSYIEGDVCDVCDKWWPGTGWGRWWHRFWHGHDPQRLD